MKKLFSFIFLLNLALFTSCQKNKGNVMEKENDEASQTEFSQTIPGGWPSPKYNFANNSITPEKFLLGRNLFYEEILSADSTMSCGSCHKQQFAFTNGPQQTTSIGMDGTHGLRNAPALFNLAWNTTFMWDGAVSNLEMQPLAPISNQLELGSDINTVIKRVQNSAKYKNLVKNAYGDTLVNSQRILKSLAQFTGLLLSNNSKYDKVKRSEVDFTTNENAGYEVYKIHCSSCHTEPLFSDYSFRNKGLPITPNQDSGRYRITGLPNDIYKFKVPSLRNLQFTAPYMHDGRFATLTEVIDFFTNGVSHSQNLDPLMAAPRFLSPEEKSNLLLFLNTLNDNTFVTDPRFSEIN
jgi:cytochrome c peroxidase